MAYQSGPIIEKFNRWRENLRGGWQFLDTLIKVAFLPEEWTQSLNLLSCLCRFEMHFSH